MYKYDKENDQIINTFSVGGYGCHGIIGHEELETLREALGLKKLNEQKYTVKVIKVISSAI